MKNNQEHKIDKIFNNSLDNQPITPPTDAWMGIHTYTIGQVESKKKVWLRYASLALVVLLFSGLGLWNSLNLDSPDLRISGLKEESKIQKSINQQRTSFHNPNSDGISSNNVESIITTSKSNKKIHKSFNLANPNSDIFSHELLMENTKNSGMSNKKIHKSINLTNPNSDDFSHELLVKNINNSKNEDNAGRVLNPDSVEKFAYSNDNIISPISEKQIENIEYKPLILNDLSEKMQKECEKRIVILEENIVDKKAVYKADSVVYGKRFSLRHPILNFRFGLYTNFVKLSANNGGEIPFTESGFGLNNIYLSPAIFGIAWKLDNRSRVSLNFNFTTYSTISLLSKSAADYIDPFSPTHKPTGTFKYNASKDTYEYLTPFGYVTQPIDPKSSSIPQDFNVQLYGSLTTWHIGTNYEYDFISLKSKKGIPALQVYGLAGINVQGIFKFRYTFSNFKNLDPNDNYINIKYPDPIIYTQSSLGNGSSIVLGYNTGLGIRFQLSKGFGLNISGNYESNINSWVKDLPFTTRLSVLSVEGGFFVNL
jgi:hypothetical protein